MYGLHVIAARISALAIVPAVLATCEAPRESPDASIDTSIVVDPPTVLPDASTAGVIFARQIKGRPPAFADEAVAFLSLIDPNEEPSRADSSCIALRGCDHVAPPRRITPNSVPRCPHDIRDAPSVDEALSAWNPLARNVVHVRGALGVGSIARTLVGCEHGCCALHDPQPIGTTPRPLRPEDHLEESAS
jgi:hypothetical protein